MFDFCKERLTMPRMISKIFTIFRRALFPTACVNCKTVIENGDVPLCTMCVSHIQILSGFYCPSCKRRLPEPKNPCHGENKYILAAATSYTSPEVRNAIYAVKYDNLQNVMTPLAQIVSEYYTKNVEPAISKQKETWITIPIPLHRSKLRKRGFNQNALLYETLVEMYTTQLPTLNATSLIRRRNTPSQIKCKNFELREKNVADCFQIKNPESIAGKNILLIDDVSTSGATLREASRILKENGAKKILALVIAKA